ncbi:hypothetical protein ACQ4PT_002712 [Festuca glaucescens]
MAHVPRTEWFPNGSASGNQATDHQENIGALDLNEMPFDLNQDAGFIPPNYFTELLGEAVGESAQPGTIPELAMENAQHAQTNTDSTFVNATNASTAALEGADDDASSQPNEPYVGMRFDTLQEAKDHYNTYAARIGFSMKQNTNRRSMFTGVVEKQQFACNQFRKPKKDDAGAEKPVNVGPVPDPVPLDEVDREAAEIASVIAELDEQNPNNRGQPKRKRETIKSNLTAGEMMGVMSEFYGTELLVPYTSKTITNYCATLKKETKEGDMAQVLNYFNEQKEKDPDFYCRYKLDAKDRVENLFWVDGAARRAYAEAYHDCISFDATYLTKKYNMPFAPFIGINRHGQSFMLGCGFVRQELATSYDWLFESFLLAMNGLAPDNIITDQDGAMRVSIERMFPTSFHRNCRWHIMQKAQLKCGPVLGRNPRLAEDFNE